ncbi:LruC domain-containing protein [bacterium]|nr:LruC domain-containing protein [bacterium]
MLNSMQICFHNYSKLLMLALVLSAVSCRNNLKEELQNQIDQNTIAYGFDFATVNAIPVRITTLGNDGSPFSTIGINISVPITDDSFAVVYRGFTNKNGLLQTELVLDANIKNVLVSTKYIGLPQNHYLTVEQLADYTIQNKGADVPGVSFPVLAHKVGAYTAKYSYMGSWDKNGVPAYKKTVRDVIPQSMLNDINSSLPEGKPVPTYNKQYLASGVETNTKILKKADVWVTFVHEGAGYKNVLGYYTYDLNNPPKTPDDINDLKIVFPNVSFSGSGGGLVSGDKVYLGQFDANTGIGWFLVANGYLAASSTVGAGNWIVYSDAALNQENNSSLKQHMVQLYDETRDLIVLGFEDILRDNSSCDNDFNDAIFYVSANPIEAIERSNLQSVKKAIDSDGDGVYDYDDEFPLDPSKSASSYSPSTTTAGSLAFEDNWPNMGDYDFNDMVVDYQYTYFTNAANELTELRAKYSLKAIGASMHNGFGVQFNIVPSLIKSVYGTNYTENYLKIASNGTEQNQSKATIIVFDNAHKLMQKDGNSNYVNTDNPNIVVDPYVFELVVKLNSGVLPTDLGKAPYNCFIIVNGNRSREVHMVDNAPTDLADLGIFGSGADKSNPDVKRYYQNKDNMPWVLHTPDPLVYPIEKQNIMDCYPYFKTWAQSEGRTNTDWYKDVPGYRVKSKLYTK